MAILRTLLFVVIGYYLWKLLSNAFGARQPRSGTSGGSNTNVKYKPEEKIHISDSTGDYIDYEEVK